MNIAGGVRPTYQVNSIFQTSGDLDSMVGGEQEAQVKEGPPPGNRPLSHSKGPPEAPATVLPQSADQQVYLTVTVFIAINICHLCFDHELGCMSHLLNLMKVAWAATAGKQLDF